MGLALYDLTFRYPKRLTLVTAGEVTEDRIDGDFHITRRVTPVPIRIAGFNLGDYEEATGSAPGVHIEVYGNRRLEAALQPRVQAPPPPEASAQTAQASGRGRLGQRSDPQHADPSVPPPAPPPPNPLARLQAVAADIASALQFFSGLFGPPALKTLTVSPIPGTFGQGFPGLVYLSTLSYLDPDQRPDSERGPREQVFFSDLMEAHEVAHQWWGDMVIPAGYQDEWLSEGLANYSALMYLEKKRGVKAMEDVLEDYRDTLLKKDANGAAAESAGPITWGFRLESAGDTAAWHGITYDKGAWILHMLRRRMGDDRFLKMLAELRRRYDSRTVSTEQFLALVKEFRRLAHGRREDIQCRRVLRQLGVFDRDSGAEAELHGEGRCAGGEDFRDDRAERCGGRFFDGGAGGDPVRQGPSANDLGADVERRRDVFGDAEAGPGEGIDSRGARGAGGEEVARQSLWWKRGCFIGGSRFNDATIVRW